MLPTSDKAGLAIYTKCTAITKDDTAANIFSALLIGANAGAVKITTREGDVIAFSSIAAGTLLPIATNVVWSTGTAITPIFGLK